MPCATCGRCRLGMPDNARQVAEENFLAQLSALDPATDRAQQSATIGKALEHKSARIVAKAAVLAGERSVRDRVPDLLGAYERFLVKPVKQDPQCIAKQAIARALFDLECGNVDFFLAGVRYQQLEPVWGGSVDTAIDVRCSCAMGLVATRYSRAIAELTTLLHDKEWRARVGAVRAISCGHAAEAEAVLRYKVLTGDSESEVIGECFTGLLAVGPEESLPWVAGYLAAERDDIRDLAALALGDSRQPKALGHLRAAWDSAGGIGEFPKVLIRAAALLRSDAAFDWLMEIIGEGAQRHADAAVEALSVYERNTRLMERMQAALTKRPAAQE
jgi:hypothetical protein